MIAMAERPGERPNTASGVDDLNVIGHTHLVRTVCTSVKVDNVEDFCDVPRMVNGATTGAALNALRKRAGGGRPLSLAVVAKAAGYKTASGVQRWFADDFDEPLSPEIAQKLAKAFTGKGRPPIQAEEVLRLSGYVPAASVGVGLSEPAAAAIVWHMAKRFGAEVELDDPDVLRFARFLIALLKVVSARQGTDDVALIEGLFAGLDWQSLHG